MSECIFCKILRGEIPSRKVYEDDLAYAFHDINPVAPIHILIIPRKHLSGVHEMSEEDRALVGHLFWVARRIAEDLELSPAKDPTRGYRLVINSGPQAGQTVFHLHLHLLGGREMTWPPG
ncbi:histidine triad nucleotide-binding protein [Thermosulfurimonas sp. F29]|uniref:histidine triad nucleotide-binding protein n=1 Tax=Thermosulfurimonas sp. F29 TaxID=2867247 RepID=UPI001C8289D2|nr:histidine triad nucleotide-binding protein [Thermosulfurimonas sp. F29]MBX6423716.1 histidine triad nucleotide-binding protein [Thermosulfurimonas sp. F29]